jgi:hypothetical protein
MGVKPHVKGQSRIGMIELKWIFRKQVDMSRLIIFRKTHLLLHGRLMLYRNEPSDIRNLHVTDKRHSELIVTWFCFRNFTEHHLAQIKRVYPAAYVFRQEKCRNFGSTAKMDQYDLTLTPLLSFGVESKFVESYINYWQCFNCCDYIALHKVGRWSWIVSIWGYRRKSLRIV